MRLRRDTRRTLVGIAITALLVTLLLLVPWYYTGFRTHTFRWLLWRELQ